MMAIDENPLKSTLLEAQVNATISGHDLGPFEPVDTRIGG